MLVKSIREGGMEKKETALRNVIQSAHIIWYQWLI